jgi:hypothetical protein
MHLAFKGMDYDPCSCLGLTLGSVPLARLNGGTETFPTHIVHVNEAKCLG